ncbi:MAG: hypothetical protein U0359_30160 [Byssovorax sp.]
MSAIAAPASAGRVGPFDVEPWPERLACHVVDPGPIRRVHGYGVSFDLALHAGPLEVAWLAFQGELPGPGARAALSTALVLLAPIHAGEAPAHAAILARIAGAPAHLLPAIAAVALGELSRIEHARLAPLRRWLDTREGPIPEVARAIDPSPEEERAHREIASASARWLGDRALPASPALDRVALAHALLHLLGLDELTVHTLSVGARLPAVLAEARCVEAAAVRAYPARLPDYAYLEDGALP